MKTAEELTIARQQVIKEAIELQERKNRDYGDSFSRTCDLFGLVVPCIRLHDKASRLIRLSAHKAEVADEKFADTWIDMFNYSMMTVQYLVKTLQRTSMTFEQTVKYALGDMLNAIDADCAPPAMCFAVIMQLHENLINLQNAEQSGKGRDKAWTILWSNTITLLSKLANASVSNIVRLKNEEDARIGAELASIGVQLRRDGQY